MFLTIYKGKLKHGDMILLLILHSNFTLNGSTVIVAQVMATGMTCRIDPEWTSLEIRMFSHETVIGRMHYQWNGVMRAQYACWMDRSL